MTGPRQARGQAGAGRARLGASWGGHEKARQAAPAGAKCEPVWASRAVEEREPGTRMGPGWFVNRSFNITLNGQAVQLLMKLPQ